MQYRCYSCGYKFWDGLPPMEALTDQQHGIVSGPRTEVEDMRLALIGTAYEGLGAANFCEPCRKAILDNPKAFIPHAGADHQLEQSRAAVWCTCGVTYDTTAISKIAHATDFRDWVEINRLQMRHISDTVNA
jgi:hypothetical protein